MRRISLALFLAGFASFSLLWCTQPLLPELALVFGVSPAESSLAVSLTTACLAISILAAAALSETVGRRGLMFASIALAALCNLFAAFAPNWDSLLAARAIGGIALGGVPAVAMAYLAEEVPRERLGQAMGLYISGTAFGGMIGRVSMGVLTEALTWRGALAAVGLICLAVSLVFIALLPRSRHFVAMQEFSVRAHLAAWRRHLRDPALVGLFLIGFLALGCFIAIYNYLGFLLSAPPYELDPAQLGLIFLAYLGGIAASWLAGGLADRYGRGPMMLAAVAIFLLGLLLTLAASLPVIVTGVVIVTAGFFMVHSTASGWVGRIAARDKGHASSLYLLSYYAGASILGFAGGGMWDLGGWIVLVLGCMLLLIVILGITLRLRILDVN